MGKVDGGYRVTIPKKILTDFGVTMPVKLYVVQEIGGLTISLYLARQKHTYAPVDVDSKGRMVIPPQFRYGIPKGGEVKFLMVGGPNSDWYIEMTLTTP